MFPSRLVRSVGLALLGAVTAAPALAQTTLTADGTTDTYTLIRNVLGGDPIEDPDCSHTAFGPHITQAFDTFLNKAAFVFHIHVTPDNDRCTNFDRQRNEIKTYGSSPSYLKAFRNEVTTYRWKFKLDAGFKPSPNFTHIHQIKAGDGDAGAPIITITPRAGSPELLQVIHTSGTGGGTVATTPLAPLKGVWVEAYEKITHDFNGRYSLVLRRLDTGATVLSYSNDAIDMWRDETTFSRPKWGIYRSLNSQSVLRDEQVRFDKFCLAKGSDDCPPDPGAPTCTVAASGAGYQTTQLTAAQNGQFTAEFDATPTASPANSLIAMSQGQQSAHTGYATLVRFGPNGTIDARDGGTYTADNAVPFAANVRYHFRLTVNVPARTYSIFVTAPGGSEQTVGTNFLFRSEQSGVTSLNWRGAQSTQGTLTVCDFVIR